MRRLLATIAVLAVSAAAVTAAELRPDTAAAWNRYVVRAERQLHQAHGPEPDGTSVNVPGGTIYHWRGSTLVHGTTVDRVVHRLMHPGTPPPQEDVLESRVVSRRGNTLHVYLKLARSVLITVVYDTEHDVVFQRHSPQMTTSRSVSTRIVETGDSDRGFLWRLNSYWRYAQVGNDVRIDLESVSLSRDVPRVTRPVAIPLANRIARESVVRTLDSVRSYVAN